MYRERKRERDVSERDTQCGYNVDLIALMRAVLHYTAAVGFLRVLSRRERRDPTS